MLMETYDHYLNSLRPFANDKAIQLTAPSALMNELSDIARARKTNRLDVIRLALSKFVHEESHG